MRPSCFPLGFLLSAAVLAPALLPAQETIFRQMRDTATDTHVEVTALFSAAPPLGYLPCRIKIANNLPTGATVNLYAGTTGRITSQTSLRFTAPGGKTITKDFLVSIPPPNGNHSGTIDFRLTGDMGTAESTFGSSSNDRNPGVLLSESLHTPNASALDAEAAKISSGGRYGSGGFSAKFTPDMLPSDWLAYSGYDVIALTPDDWAEIPAGPRSAIVSWIHQGGQLISVGPEASWNAPGMPENPGLGRMTHRRESGTAITAPADFVNDAWSGTESLASSTVDGISANWGLPKELGAKNFNFLLFGLVLVAFSIVVGPINLFVLAGSGRRHRLFITTPLISIAASLLMVAIIIFQDGFGGKGIRRTLMEIQPDGNGHTAHILQEQFSRTGMLSGTGFTTEPAALIAPVVLPASRWARFTNDYKTSGAFDIGVSGGKSYASGGWWKSRSEQGQFLSAVKPTRGRIEPGKSPGSFVSTFDFPIEDFYLRGAGGKWFHASSVQTGREFIPLPAADAAAAAAIERQVRQFGNRTSQLLERASTRPGHFVAITGTAPAIETLGSIDWEKSHTVITGPAL